MSAGQPILFALIHSPLTGPMVWQPVAHFLRALGHQVIVPDLADTAGTAKPIWSQHVAAAVSAIARAAAEQRAHSTVLVAHSGAGPF
jgi:pimeloyl-ACP methyl ester carboxylesterase